MSRKPMPTIGAVVIDVVGKVAVLAGLITFALNLPGWMAIYAWVLAAGTGCGLVLAVMVLGFTIEHRNDPARGDAR